MCRKECNHYYSLPTNTTETSRILSAGSSRNYTQGYDPEYCHGGYNDGLSAGKLIYYLIVHQY